MRADSLMTRRRRAHRETGINLTPLVDVMFQLMIFILVTAQYTNVYSMKVDLPKAETAQKVGEKKVIVVSLTEDERIFFEKEEVTLTELESLLRDIVHKEKPPQIILRADEKSTTGVLVQVMDIVQKVGLKRVSLQTEK